jgi:hypothetical protein
MKKSDPRSFLVEIKRGDIKGEIKNGGEFGVITASGQ